LKSKGKGGNMKVQIIEKPKPEKFQPFKVEIEIMNLNDLKAFIARLNISPADIREKLDPDYQGSFTGDPMYIVFDKVDDYINDNKINIKK
jgi:hypothetical protein